MDTLFIDLNRPLHLVKGRFLHKDFDPNVSPEESSVFEDLFGCIDQVVRAAKPQKLIFIAVDGERCYELDFANKVSFFLIVQMNDIGIASPTFTKGGKDFAAERSPASCASLCS